MEVIFMDQIEKQLLEEKKKIDAIKVPEELEGRLRNALHTTPKRAKRIILPWKLVAVALCIIVIIGTQYNAFAYYGKKLLGFDEMISGTLKELNNEGMGQIVDQKRILEDGTELIIDGIMTDENQLILYYTMRNLDGLEGYDAGFFSSFNITGFLTKSHHMSGTSIMNEDQTEIKVIDTFEPVSPFAKKLTLNYRQDLQNGQWLDDSISFSYNPNKAMQTEVHQRIKETVTVDQGEVTFNNIIASPMSTVIKGKLNVENFDRMNIGLHGVELIANGSPVELIGSGSRSALGGSKFEIRYDGLPEQLESLMLVMKEFVGYQVLQEKIPLNSSREELYMLEDKELWVRNVSSTGEGIEITIVTDEDVLLDGVSVETENGLIPLKTTVKQDYLEQENGKILKERTLVFETKLEPKYLLLEGMHYVKAYHHVIDIPID
jgi:hypothetical protein